jgi:hypothetical protein
MQAWLAIALAIEVANIIVSTSAVQRNTNDTKAFISVIVSIVNALIILSLLMYYLMEIYPIISGR